MKIVIDIPEDVLKRTVFYREFIDLNDCVTTIKALEKAITLPKHHGKLIDADALEKEMTEYISTLPLAYAEAERIVLLMNHFDDAPTIIERSDNE